MKKLLYLISILVLCMSFATPAVAQDGVPAPQQPGGTGTNIYLPSVMLMMLKFSAESIASWSMEKHGVFP